MAEALAENPQLEEPKQIMLRQLINNDVEWPLVFENGAVRIYSSPANEG